VGDRRAERNYGGRCQHTKTDHAVRAGVLAIGENGRTRETLSRTLIRPG
jgi:hypothetical protein